MKMNCCSFLESMPNRVLCLLVFTASPLVSGSSPLSLLSPFASLCANYPNVVDIFPLSPVCIFSPYRPHERFPFASSPFAAVSRRFYWHYVP